MTPSLNRHVLRLALDPGAIALGYVQETRGRVEQPIGLRVPPTAMEPSSVRLALELVSHTPIPRCVYTFEVLRFSSSSGVLTWTLVSKKALSAGEALGPRAQSVFRQPAQPFDKT